MCHEGYLLGRSLRKLLISDEKWSCGFGGKANIFRTPGSSLARFRSRIARQADGLPSCFAPSNAIRVRKFDCCLESPTRPPSARKFLRTKATCIEFSGGIGSVAGNIGESSAAFVTGSRRPLLLEIGRAHVL